MIKKGFIDSLEVARSCPILSVNILSTELNDCEDMIGSLSIILEKRRNFYLLNLESENLGSKVDLETEDLEEMYAAETHSGTKPK